MHVVRELISHFQQQGRIAPSLQDRFVELGLMDAPAEWEDVGFPSLEDCCFPRGHCFCDTCREARFGVPSPYEGDEFEKRWIDADTRRRQKVCRGLRGKRGRRREATVEVIRDALQKQYRKWELPGARLDRLNNLGNYLQRCSRWQEAAQVLVSCSPENVVQELRLIERRSPRSFLNQLDDFDLALLSFARPWRGQVGAALRRLVQQQPDKRSRKLLKFQEFQDALRLLQVAEHLKRVRRACRRTG